MQLTVGIERVQSRGMEGIEARTSWEGELMRLGSSLRKEKYRVMTPDFCLRWFEQMMMSSGKNEAMELNKIDHGECHEMASHIPCQES